jgi:hypothetical protein
MIRSFDLSTCRVRFFDWGVETEFPSGGISSNWPLRDDKHWLGIAAAAGYDDPLRYCQEHDFFHAFLADRWFGKASYVLYQAAHNLPIDERASAWEERLIFDVQRAFRGYTAAPVSWTEAIAEARKILSPYAFASDGRED